jgi:pimeloyl-ACP methyl ester carboxylesterase
VSRFDVSGGALGVLSSKRRPPRQPVAAGAVALALAVAACSGGADRASDDGGDRRTAATSASPSATTRPAPASGSESSGSGTAGSGTTSASPPAAVPKGLERFYSQRPAWSACGEDFQCTRVEVPVDYGRPSGDVLRLSLIRLPAGSRGDRLGSLVLNPGGPGASGVDYARRAGTVVSDAVRRRFDVVGFDPRGVGRSEPLRCLDDRETDALIGADPTPDDAAEVRAAAAQARDLAAQCAAGGGALLAHVGTEDAARDMDVLRAVLRDRQLNYLGKSYGTFLGATYAERFPRNVGRFVLDGALDPALDADAVNIGQAQGFERATRAYAADCVRQRACPLGSDVDGAVARLQRLLRDLDARPLPTRARGRPLTEGRGSLGVAAAMYDRRFWPVLTQGLASAISGDGSMLLAMADALTDRGPEGFRSNANTAIFAVNCLDRPGRGGLAQLQRSLPRYTGAAPTWGAYLAWSGLPCAYWPVRDGGRPHALHARGSGPIVVVGTTRDPATPYAWAQGLARELDAGHLITYDGDGHTAYRRGSSCIDQAVDAYLLRLQTPSAGLRCD